MTDYVEIEVNVNDSRLIYDTKVQRREGTSSDAVKKIGATFDPHSFRPITLSQREDGALSIVDGAHRLEAARLLGHSTINAQIHTGLSLAQECAMFAYLNTQRKVSAISRMKTEALAGADQGFSESEDIVEIIESQGFRIAQEVGRNVFAAVAAAQSVYRNGAGAIKKRGAYYHVLEQTMRIIRKAWDGDADSVQSQIVKGLGQVVARYGDRIDEDKMAHLLSGENPRRIVADGKYLGNAQGGTIHAAVAKNIVTIYNKRNRKDPLPEWVWVR